MDDAEVLATIGTLAEEEHEIYEREGKNEASASDRERRQQIEVTLDRCWDLLHQRRALRSAGQDPEAATPRDERTVEGYVG